MSTRISRFGTNSDMIIQQVEEEGQTLLLAIDSRGLYLTEPKMVDSFLADPFRYTGDRKQTNDRLISLGLDPVALSSANQHRIQKLDSTTQKVNPLKASKRMSRGAKG